MERVEERPALMDALMAVSAKENAIDLAVLGLRMKAAR